MKVILLILTSFAATLTFLIAVKLTRTEENVLATAPERIVFSETETPEPPNPEPKLILPKHGITVPGAKTYILQADGVVVFDGSLKNAYFDCSVLKEMNYKGNKYYLIRIRQSGYQSNIYVLDVNGIHILP